MLNPNAQLWVEALESGAYAQTDGVLCRLDVDGNPKGFCCLGVACEVYNANVPEEERLPAVVGPQLLDNNERARIYGEGYVGSYTLLPIPVQEWLNLATTDGAIMGCAVNLPALNDDGSTFEEIAALIKQEPEGLFR